jgi:hypothetical protein
MATSVKHIDESRLEKDLAYRFEYLCEFMGFGEKDIKTILGAAPLLAPIVPALVDAVYEKLFSYDATKRHFMVRQDGYNGAVPADLDAITHDHELIKFRKSHLAKYLAKLVTGPYDAEMVKYLDLVGMIHTPKAGNKDLNVPLVQMNALMGFVADAVNSTIIGLSVPQEAKNQAIKSFTKLLWIQNDLINRHYQA